MNELWTESLPVLLFSWTMVALVVACILVPPVATVMDWTRYLPRVLPPRARNGEYGDAVEPVLLGELDRLGFTSISFVRLAIWFHLHDVRTIAHFHLFAHADGHCFAFLPAGPDVCASEVMLQSFFTDRSSVWTNAHAGFDTTDPAHVRQAVPDSNLTTRFAAHEAMVKRKMAEGCQTLSHRSYADLCRCPSRPCPKRRGPMTAEEKNCLLGSILASVMFLGFSVIGLVIAPCIGLVIPFGLLVAFLAVMAKRGARVWWSSHISRERET